MNCRPMLNPSASLEWYKQASANLRKYLPELEVALASGQFSERKPTEYLITEVKRRIEDFDRLIKEAE
jgi:hypothetical protein